MKKNILKILLVMLFGFILFTGKAQQNNTLFFMDKIPQASLMNPANKPYCKFYLGLPLISSVYFNYGNNGFSYHDLIYLDNKDKLILDPDNFFNVLNDVNNISFDTEFNLFALGFKLGKSFLSINATQKNDFGFSIPKGFFGLFLEGNGKHIGSDDPLDLSGFGFDLNVYSEISAGISRTFGNSLTIGLRGKYYIGVVNLTTEKSDLKWFTDENWNWKFVSDMSFQLASPIEVNLTDTTKPLGPDPNMKLNADDFTKFENAGYGMDIGVSYDVTRKLTLSASLIDLGSINWKSNTQNFKSSAQFEWNGFDATPLIQGDAVDFSKFADTLLTGFDFSENNDPYKTKIPTKLYLGASYFLNSNWGIGALYRAKYYNDATFKSLTLSASTGLGNMLSLTGSYSIAYNTYNNVGLGLGLKLAFMQFYLVNDNVFGVIYPHKARNINTRFGFNIIMGCRYHKRAAKAKKEKDELRQQQEVDPTLFF